MLPLVITDIHDGSQIVLLTRNDLIEYIRDHCGADVAYLVDLGLSEEIE